LEGGSFGCKGGTGGVWFLLVGIRFCEGRMCVVLGCVSSVGLRVCVAVHPRLWRLGGGFWVVLMVGGVLEEIVAVCRARSH
jgi:hypothetical protein